VRVSLVSGDATAPEQSLLSVPAGDVYAAYVVVNIVGHPD